MIIRNTEGLSLLKTSIVVSFSQDMPTKTYNNPPLIEAVCEFRFVLEKGISEEQINVFYEKIKDVFPVQKKRKMHQVEFKIEAEKTEEENKKNFNQNFYEFEQYLSQDEKYSVQLDAGRVSIHRTKPYTSWEDFFPMINQVYTAYVETFVPVQIGRIGIRYINEVSVPTEDFSFDKYFTVNVSLPSLEESKQISIFLGSVFEQEDGRDALKVQFVEKQVKEPQGQRIFSLDFDYFLVQPVISFEEANGWMSNAHTNLENVFEGMITGTTRTLFDKK